jgi:hypothetical protein
MSSMGEGDFRESGASQFRYAIVNQEDDGDLGVSSVGGNQAEEKTTRPDSIIELTPSNKVSQTEQGPVESKDVKGGSFLQKLGQKLGIKEPVIAAVAGYAILGGIIGILAGPIGVIAGTAIGGMLGAGLAHMADNEAVEGHKLTQYHSASGDPVYHEITSPDNVDQNGTEVVSNEKAKG